MKHRLLLVLIILFAFSISVDAQTRYARVTAENANIRDTPSVSGVSQLEVAEGTSLKILDEKLPWYVVRVDNRVGWIHGNTIEFTGYGGSITKTPRPRSVLPEYTPPAPSAPRRESLPAAPARTTSESRGYIRGPRGGCYYYSGSGRKVYVDRSLCN